MVVDTGNGGPTLFPSHLIEYATNVRPCKIQISGIAGDIITAESMGAITFIVPTDPSGTAEISVEGAFVDTDEVLISRKDLPGGFEITKGASNFAKAALRSHPDVTLALDNNCSALWALKRKTPLDKQDHVENKGITTHLSQSAMRRLGLQNGEGSLSRVVSLFHSQLGHPCPKRTFQSLSSYGIQIPYKIVEEVTSVCRICKDKPHNNRPVNNTTQDRDGLIEQDLTQFSFEGVGKEKWISVIYDMEHRFIDAMALKNKTDAPLHTAQFLSRHQHVKRWRVDNAPELNSETMKKTLMKHGVSLECTAPGSSWSNGGVERANQTIKQIISNLMVHLHVDSWPELWPWFISAACHAHNSTFNETLNTTPLSSISGKPTNIDTLFPSVPFGAGVHFINTTDGKKRISIKKQIPGIFLGINHSGSAEIIEPIPTEDSASRHIAHPRTIQLASDETTSELRNQLRLIAQGPNSNTTNKEESRHHRNVKSKARLIRTIVTFDPEQNIEWVCTSFPHKSKVLACNLHDPNRHTTIDLKNCRNITKTLTIQMDNKVKVLKANGHYLTGFGYIAADEAKPEDVQAGLFKEADTKEWTCIVDNQVLGQLITDTNNIKPIRTRFRRIFKSDGKAKTRFVVCATNDNRQVPTTTHLPLQYARRVCHILGLCKQWKAAVVDVQTAFLLVPIEDDIYIRLPPSLPPIALEAGHVPNGIYKLNRALYGLKESPRLFQLYMERVLGTLHFVKIDDGIFARLNTSKRDAIMITYVDDVLCWSDDPNSVLAELKDILPCAEITPITNDPTRYVGEDIVASEQGIVAISMASFIKDLPTPETIIENLPPPYNGRRLHPSNLPLDEFDEGFTSLDLAQQEKVIEIYRSLVGSLGWIASAHPGMAYRFGELARYAKSPGIPAFRIALSCLREITKEADLFTELSPVEHPIIRVWTDANLRSGRSRRGWCIQLLDADEPLSSRRNIISWKSAKDERKATDDTSNCFVGDILHHSSVSAEVYSIYKATQEINDVIYTIRNVLKPMFSEIPIHIYTDSLSGVEQIRNEKGTKQERVRNDQIRSWMYGLGLSLSDLRHGSGEMNMADALTKPKPLDWYQTRSVYH